MINLQSPHFSHSSKIELMNKMSPSVRNRVPSTQDLYTSSQWNKVQSCKKLDSPSKLSQKKRKRSQNSQCKNKIKKNDTQQNIVSEVTYLKEQYKSLKDAYQDLIQEKLKNSTEMAKSKQEVKSLASQNQKLGKENQNLRAKVSFMEVEIERIKKQSCKLIEIEQFKVRQLQESNKEKQIHRKPKDQNIQNVGQDISYTFQTKENKAQSLFPENDSLIISHEKTLSNQSQFISVSLTSMMENQSQWKHDLSTKRKPEALKELPLNPQQNIIDLGQKKVKNENSNMKKIRKELTKKLDINIDEKHKEYFQIVKTPMERKISKSHKGSKSRLKKEDEKQNSDSKNSKKRIIHR